MDVPRRPGKRLTAVHGSQPVQVPSQTLCARSGVIWGKEALRAPLFPKKYALKLYVKVQGNDALISPLSDIIRTECMLEILLTDIIISKDSIIWG